MAQVNNNAESLSRELRKLKNVKSLDFRGLLSGNSESYINLFRHLFCEHNLAFSRYIVEKGYDLSGLSDYKFMESVYKMMRDLFNLKAPINQNQFFSQGFTQRKLEMSTMIVTHVRKVIYELTNRTGKKTVQTQALIKSSLRRPNSAPKQTRVVELGDDDTEDVRNQAFSVAHSNRGKKSKSGSKVATKSAQVTLKPKPSEEYVTHDDDDTNNASSESERSNPANSYNFNQKPTSQIAANGDHQWNYHKSPPYREQTDVTSVSAYEMAPPVAYGGPSDIYGRARKPNLYIGPSDVPEYRAYDVKQYTPRSDDEHMINNLSRGDTAPLDKIMKQFDTVLARITLLESRMQRIEMKFDAGKPKPLSEHQPAPHSFYSNQTNDNYQQFSVPHPYHETNKLASYNERKPEPVHQDTRNIITDFESNYQGQAMKHDIDKPYQTYGNNTTGSYRSHISSDISNSTVPKYVSSVTNYSNKRLPDANNSSRENSYRSATTGPRVSQHVHKIPNGIPPIHPTMKKSDDSGFDENRGGKLNYEKDDSYIQSQTDRIASLLSDTQKMLRISDEEL